MTNSKYTRCYTPMCRREPICVPVMVIPIKNYPLPAYSQLRGALCHQCAAAFNINKFTDYQGSWYVHVCDYLRDLKKPAVNPFPTVPTFKGEDFIIEPNWEPAKIEDCYLQLWKLETLVAKGMRQKLW